MNQEQKDQLTERWSKQYGRAVERMGQAKSPTSIKDYHQQALETKLRLIALAQIPVKKVKPEKLPKCCGRKFDDDELCQGCVAKMACMEVCIVLRKESLK